MSFFRSQKESYLWIFALGLVVFFSACRMQGLQPDAALYAGLSLKVLSTTEGWRLSGTSGFFSTFHEHPPFFFIWGAQVLRFLGENDGAARAIGGIPGFLGFLILCFWTARRWGTSTAIATAFALATFGHYTKFAATAMLEGPLSLGTILAAIGAYELRWNSPSAKKRLGSAFVLLAGLVIASAAKGIAGFGAWGGVALTLLIGQSLRKLFASLLFLMLALLASFLPLLLWAWKMASLNSLDWIAGYWIQQVGVSMSSNRGDSSHASHGDNLFYLKMILLNGWPWWWTVPACVERMKNGAIGDLALRRWAYVGAAFFISFVVPFSLVSFQLAHYLHPVYLVLAPLGGYYLAHVLFPFLFKKLSPTLKARAAEIRWGLLVFAGISLFAAQSGITSTSNRGQVFVQAWTEIQKLPADCPVLVPQDSMDPYRMEAFALWYWKGQSWRLVPTVAWQALAKGDINGNYALWDPVAAPFSVEASHCLDEEPTPTSELGQ